MKRISILFTLLLFIFPIKAQIYNKSNVKRIEKIINTNWTFNYFPEENADEKGYEQPGFDDSKWSAIAIPHTWMTYETTGELHPYIKNASPNDNSYWWNGWGWYRKRLVIGKEFTDRKIFIEFDAVQKYSKIWLNGIYLGDHKGGYTSFYVDITKAVKFGDENILVVAANNTMKDKFSIPPMSAGNFDVYGGITRDVRLVITNKLFVPFQGSYKHEGGTFVFTPKVNKNEGLVTVNTFVKNEYNEAKNAQIKTILTDEENQIIEEIYSSATIPKNQIHQFKQISKPVKNPKLWSPATPTIYNVYTEVYLEDNLVDNYYSPLGFRWYNWDYATDKLHLNGKEIHIHGQNRHEEYIWLGGAVPKWLALRDMNDIRYGLEHNFMRTAHYPHDPSIYNFTDRNGIFINEELPNIKNQEFNDEVQKQNLQEMIRRDRNHPSIFFWSMGNETTDAANSLWAHQEDTTRIITSRHVYNNTVGDYAPHSEKNMSIEGFLRCTIKGWYDTDERNLEPADQQHAGTEVNDVTRALQKGVQKHYGSVWLYADHGADREYVNSPLKHINPKGWVDSWRNPKYKYYLWQANFASKPMVFAQYHFWREKYIGQKKDFWVNSNCEQVELFINEKSKGIQKTNYNNEFTTIFEEVEVEKGILEIVGSKSDGTRVSYKIEMAGKPAKIIVKPSHTRATASLNSVVEIKADITDKNNIHVIGANPNLKWKVAGPAKLVGPELYISDRNRIEEVEGTMYIDVPVTNLIRSTGKPGKVTVTVLSGGLEMGKTEIEFVKYDDSNPVKGIIEPALQMAKREPVQHNMNQVSRVVAPQEMKNYSGELQLKINEIQPKLKEILVQHNPEISTETTEFNYVIEIFTQMMKANNGRLVADDYNFVVEQYNISREITRLIEEKDLPEAFKWELSNYYAFNIVFKGRTKNFIFQKELISKIPNGGKALIINAESKNFKDCIYTSETNLPTLLKQVYPETESFSKDEFKNALDFLVNVNPYISSTRIRDRETKIYTYSYKVEHNRIFLFPSSEILRNEKFPEENF